MIDLPYFDSVSLEIKKQLLENREKIFSCEFVTVHPELRARFSRIQHGDLIMGLAFKVFEFSSCTSAMGFSREDNKADKMAMRFGFEKIDRINLHGINCGVMILKKQNLKEHPLEIASTEIKNKFNNMSNSFYHINIPPKDVA